MSFSLRAAALVIALLATGSAGSAAAEEQEEEALLRTEKHVSELAPDARPTPFSPYHFVRAEAFPAYVLELFGETAGFSLGRRLNVFELEGGAALRVLDHTRLTASFRMLSSEGGSEERGEGLPLARHLAAPFLGIALDF
jgi:hypothetical protein